MVLSSRERSDLERAESLSFILGLLTIGSGLRLSGGFLNQCVLLMLQLREAHVGGDG